MLSFLANQRYVTVQGRGGRVFWEAWATLIRINEALTRPELLNYPLSCPFPFPHTPMLSLVWEPNPLILVCFSLDLRTLPFRASFNVPSTFPQSSGTLFGVVHIVRGYLWAILGTWELP